MQSIPRQGESIFKLVTLVQIDFMDYNAVGWIMIAVWLLSLSYPWLPSWPLAKWLLHLPLLLLALYWCYELAMPGHMNIRLDLPLIWACMIISGILYLMRIILFALMQRRSKTHERA